MSGVYTVEGLGRDTNERWVNFLIFTCLVLICPITPSFEWLSSDLLRDLTYRDRVFNKRFVLSWLSSQRLNLLLLLSNLFFEIRKVSEVTLSWHLINSYQRFPMISDGLSVQHSYITVQFILCVSCHGSYFFSVYEQFSCIHSLFYICVRSLSLTSQTDRNRCKQKGQEISLIEVVNYIFDTWLINIIKDK